jgi:hypothetical protein
MPTSRRKLSAVYRDFYNEIRRLERYNRENQAKFSASVAALGPVKLSKRQLFMLTEAVFFTGYRGYENFLRDIFLLYCMERKPKSGQVVISYLQPRDFQHAEMLIQSSMPFLDWSNPNAVIVRAELYLAQGFPIKLPISTNQDLLADYKRIRNHIAHNSKESLDEYKKTIRKHLGTIPLNIPSPGEFLLHSERRMPHKYKLLTFFDLMKKLANDLT